MYSSQYSQTLSWSRVYVCSLARGTETLAVPQPDGSYRLYGYKWFSSATDADMTFTLARVTDNTGTNFVDGTKGLSMFYLKVGIV